MDERPVLEIAIGLLHEGPNLLIAQRKAGTHLAGMWEFPGGKVEEGETPAEAVRREFLEEVGLSVTVGELFHRTRHEYAQRIVDLRFFTCQLLRQRSEQACALQVEQLRWVPIQALGDYRFPDGNDEVLRKLAGLVSSTT